MTHDELASALVRHRIVHPDAVEYSEGYDNCETIANIIALHMELFPVTPSYPPALDRARNRYNAAIAAYERASLHEDESGEAIPQEITREYREAARWLKQEEQFRAISTEIIES